MLIEPINVVEKKAEQTSRKNHYSSQLAVIAENHGAGNVSGGSMDQLCGDNETEGDDQCTL